MMNIHVEERLTAYLANEVPSEERTHIENHLASCRDCQEELETLIELELILNDMPLEQPNSEFTQKVMSKIQEESWIQQKSKKSPSRLSMLGNFAASAAAVMMFVYILNIFAPQFPKYESAVKVYGETAETQVKHGLGLMMKVLGGK